MNNKNIKNRAYEFLRTQPETRLDDRTLGFAFVKASPNYAIQPISLEEYLTVSVEYLFNFYGMPRLETIGRYRREFLRTNQVFKPNNDVNTRATDPSKKFKAGPESLFTQYK